MNEQNKDKNPERIITLEEIVDLIMDKSSSEHKPFFDFIRYNDHILMTLIKKYSVEISKVDFSKTDPQSLEDTIENLSSDLCDSISDSHMDYFKHGMKLGARLVTELII